jgi:hypothetical protein
MSSMNVGDWIQKDITAGMPFLMERLGYNANVKEKQDFYEGCRQKCSEYLASPSWQAVQDNPSGFPDEAFGVVEAVILAHLDVRWTVLTELDPGENSTTMKRIKSVCSCSLERIPVVRSIVEGTHQSYACFCGKHQMTVQQELNEETWMTVLANICNTFEHHCTAILTNAVAEIAGAPDIPSSSMSADQYSITEPHQ